MPNNNLTLVTGATGFVGSHVVRLLCGRGEPVRVFVRKQSPVKNLEGLDVEFFEGDLTDLQSVRQAMRGCVRVYHVAADYRLWSPDPRLIYRTNVQGTRNMLEAAREAGVERMVYTSTVGALGVSRHEELCTEETPVTLQEMIGHYKRSKFLAEAEAMAAARAGLPVVIVNPSTPVGSMDVKPTPTGQIILDFINHRMPAYVDTGFNLVDVEDVAVGHLLAMEKGQAGERYILGCRNVTLKEMLEMLARISGVPAPTFRVPPGLAFGIGLLSTGLSAVTKRPPRVSLEAVRMSRKKMFFDGSKAVRRLGLPQHSVEDALQKAVVWFRQHGYAGNGS